LAGAFLVSSFDGGDVWLLPGTAGSTVRPKGSVADIAARILPAVARINVAGTAGAGTGSGVVIRKDGYILTNNHVVEGGGVNGKTTVGFSNGKTSGATIIGRDESYDLAVIRVAQDDLPVLVLGESSAVVVGDPVIAAGALLGLDSTTPVASSAR